MTEKQNRYSNGGRYGVYVHVALCRSKCLYCDFYSRPLTPAFDWHSYLDALVREFKMRSDALRGYSSVTLYFGGGTPSLIPENLVGVFIAAFIEEIKRVCNPDGDIPEITLEVNPDDVTPNKVRIWREAGINRISMGVQSLNDRELRAIGRRHNSSTAIKAYETLRKEFDNISLDLMFGLPEQTLQSLKESIEGFVNMRPQHISAYSLMYEERSALTRLRDSGKIKEADENLSVSMFESLCNLLNDAGYQRYEISNYSLPGFESRHNSSYWDGVPYLGIGPSAHSFDGGNVRSWNPADIKEYIAGVQSGNLNRESEILTRNELLEERIMTSLRTSRGIDLHLLSKEFGKTATEMLLKKAEKHILDEYLYRYDNHLVLTDKGVMISDEIILSLFP